MLECVILGTALAILPPAPFCPAYLPLPETLAATRTRPVDPPTEDLPSFPIPVPRSSPAGHAATLRPEVTDDDLPSFPIAVPHQGPEETPMW